MPCYITKPDWSQAFTGATHLLEIPATKKYVFAYQYKDDFYSSTMMLATFHSFRVVEVRPVKLKVSSSYGDWDQAQNRFFPDMDVVNLYNEKVPDYVSEIEANGIRKAVKHLKETHGGDRFSSSAYLAYADELEGVTNALS